jgi:hypothetical protein
MQATMAHVCSAAGPMSCILRQGSQFCSHNATNVPTGTPLKDAGFNINLLNLKIFIRSASRLARFMHTNLFKALAPQH